jgi:hypothetical protein
MVARAQGLNGAELRNYRPGLCRITRCPQPCVVGLAASTPNGKLMQGAPGADFAGKGRWRAPHRRRRDPLALLPVLGVSSVGIEDNFEMGGHYPCRSVVAGSTPAWAEFPPQPVRSFDGRRTGQCLAPGGRPVLEPFNARPVPASLAQRRLWFIDRLKGQSTYGIRWRSACAVSWSTGAEAARRWSSGTKVCAHFTESMAVFQRIWTASPTQTGSGACHESTSGAQRAARYCFDLSEIPLRAFSPWSRMSRLLLRFTIARMVGRCCRWSRPTKSYAARWRVAQAGLPVQYADYTLWQQTRARERPGELLGGSWLSGKRRWPSA